MHPLPFEVAGSIGSKQAITVRRLISPASSSPPRFLPHLFSNDYHDSSHDTRNKIEVCFPFPPSPCFPWLLLLILDPCFSHSWCSNCNLILNCIIIPLFMHLLPLQLYF
ncbi:hypothetical protein CC2G_007749 [Coprinopsis cinerea AmutBmut pab1-1]|nr:hypothetical protein CC2G_007749 [Coprinopsis cinerea AmutBmut pab1-1]